MSQDISNMDDVTTTAHNGLKEIMMLTKNTEKFIAEAQHHVAQDLIVRGKYEKNEAGQSCFIGCHTGGNNPELLQDLYGFPLMLTRICESIFEALPLDLGIAFHAAIPAAVGVDGKDLSRVQWAFFADILRAMPPQKPKNQDVIDTVIAGMDLLAGGKEWPTAAADAADAADAAARSAYAAYAAARAADAADAAARAAAAADAADAAARSAYAAPARDAARAAAARDASAAIRQRDTILRLIADAPV